MKAIDRAIKMCDSVSGVENYYSLLKRDAYELQRILEANYPVNPQGIAQRRKDVKYWIEKYKGAGGKRDISQYEALLKKSPKMV